MAQSFPVLLVRHAPVMVPEGVCYGRQDVALRPGWERVTSGLAVLAQGAVCRVLYTSPAARCQQMARKLAASTGMELRIDPRLAEMNFGEWEGRLWQDIDRGLLDAWAADPEGFVPPGGESGRALCHRVRAFWQEVQQASTPACVLSHGGPLRVLSALAAGTPPALLAPSMPQGFARLFMVGASPDFTPETEEDAAPQSRRETGALTGSKTNGSVTQRLSPVVPLWPRRHRPVPAEPALTFPKTDTGPVLT